MVDQSQPGSISVDFFDGRGTSLGRIAFDPTDTIAAIGRRAFPGHFVDLKFNSRYLSDSSILLDLARRPNGGYYPDVQIVAERPDEAVPAHVRVDATSSKSSSRSSGQQALHFSNAQARPSSEPLFYGHSDTPAEPWPENVPVSTMPPYGRPGESDSDSDSESDSDPDQGPGREDPSEPGREPSPDAVRTRRDRVAARGESRAPGSAAIASERERVPPDTLYTTQIEGVPDSQQRRSHIRLHAKRAQGASSSSSPSALASEEKSATGGGRRGYSAFGSNFIAPPASGDMTRPPWSIPAGDVETTRKIGEGFFGKVYLASWNGLDVVVKYLKNVKESSMVAFWKEVDLLSRLRFPHICQFLGAITDAPHYSIVMEYMPNGSLHDVIHVSGVPKEGPLSDLGSLKATLRIGRQVAMGLNYLHTFSPIVLHRDLSSSNLLLDPLGNAKISDFGLSRPFDSSMSGYGGNYLYMAPESFTRSEYTTASDVYSFGILLWEVHRLARPFGGTMNPAFAAAQAATANARPPLERGAAFPADLADLIERCWHEEPDMRPTASEIISTISTMLHDHFGVDQSGSRAQMLAPGSPTPLSSSGSSSSTSSSMVEPLPSTIPGGGTPVMSEEEFEAAYGVETIASLECLLETKRHYSTSEVESLVAYIRHEALRGKFSLATMDAHRKKLLCVVTRKESSARRSSGLDHYPCAGSRFVPFDHAKAAAPKVGDLAVCRVESTSAAGAVCSLLEYSDTEYRGAVMTKELSRRQMSSVSKLLKVGQEEVLRILRVDPIRKFVDLSRKDVDAATAYFARCQYDQALDSHKLLADVARTLDCCLHCCYLGLGWPLARRYGSLYQAMQRSLIDPINVLEHFNACRCFEGGSLGATLQALIARQDSTNTAVVDESKSPPALQTRRPRALSGSSSSVASISPLDVSILSPRLVPEIQRRLANNGGPYMGAPTVEEGYAFRGDSGCCVLSSLGLDEVPFSSKHLSLNWSMLTTLNVEDNPHLRFLSHRISQCTNLSELNCNGCSLSHVPVELTQLKQNLKRLYLFGNSFQSFPATVCELSQLEELNLNQNEISKLPRSIGQLANLRELTLNDNRIESIPESIAGLTRLHSLSLSHNRLRGSLPVALCSLVSLYSLDLRSNDIDSIPSEFGALVNLEWFDLSQNHIQAFPLHIARKLSRLSFLDLTANVALCGNLGAVADLQQLIPSVLHDGATPTEAPLSSDFAELSISMPSVNSRAASVQHPLPLKDARIRLDDQSGRYPAPHLLERTSFLPDSTAEAQLPHSGSLPLSQQPLDEGGGHVESVEPVAVSEWSVDQVCDWVGSFPRFSRFVDRFRENEIGGETLLELDKEDLKEMDIRQLGVRKDLLRAIKTLSKSPPKVPKFSPSSPDQGTAVVGVSHSSSLSSASHALPARDHAPPFSSSSSPHRHSLPSSAQGEFSPHVKAPHVRFSSTPPPQRFLSPSQGISNAAASQSLHSLVSPGRRSSSLIPPAGHLARAVSAPIADLSPVHIHRDSTSSTLSRNSCDLAKCELLRSYFLAFARRDDELVRSKQVSCLALIKVKRSVTEEILSAFLRKPTRAPVSSPFQGFDSAESTHHVSAHVLTGSLFIVSCYCLEPHMGLRAIQEALLEIARITVARVSRSSFVSTHDNHAPESSSKKSSGTARKPRKHNVRTLKDCPLLNVKISPYALDKNDLVAAARKFERRRRQRLSDERQRSGSRRKVKPP